MGKKISKDDNLHHPTLPLHSPQDQKLKETSAKHHFRQRDEAEIHLAENITTPCLSSCGGYEGYEGRNCLLSREITSGYQYLPLGHSEQ